MTIKLKTSYLLTLAVVTLCSLSCGKSVDLTGGDSSQNNGLASGEGLQQSQCSENRTVQWSFHQPLTQTNRSVDLLFVVDSSLSLLHKRALIAATIPAFVAQLSPETDYRIAVMQAHGGASRHSGRLYAAPTSPLVLNSKTMTTPLIQANLTKTLSRTVLDADEAGGEMMMYSLLKSLEPANFATIQAQGFYRPDAALSVVFVTDENDGCYRPEQNGFTNFPDFVPSPTGNELIAYNRYCLNQDGSPRVTADAVFAALNHAKSGQQLSLGAITHTDPALVPQGRYVEHSIGHGIIELVTMTPQHVLLEITNADYSHGLAELGTVVQNQLHLDTSFYLNNASAVDETTLQVSVDGRPTPFKFEQNEKTIVLKSSDAGTAGSIVLVAACLK